MITVMSVTDNPARWPDYLAVYEACQAAGLPDPVEECIALGPPRPGWRESTACDVLAAYLHTGHALVNVDGEIMDWADAVKTIKGGQINMRKWLEVAEQIVKEYSFGGYQFYVDREPPIFGDALGIRCIYCIQEYNAQYKRHEEKKVGMNRCIPSHQLAAVHDLVSFLRMHFVDMARECWRTVRDYRRAANGAR
jgi:hypothetical protein